MHRNPIPVWADSTAKLIMVPFATAIVLTLAVFFLAGVCNTAWAPSDPDG